MVHGIASGLDAAGDADVWVSDLSGDSPPRILVPTATSPSVVVPR